MKQHDEVTVKTLKLGLLYHLLPSQLIADPKDNARFGAPKDLKALTADIKANGVRQNVEARPLTDEEAKANPGKLGRLTFGWNRHISLSDLLEDDKDCAIRLPVIFRDVKDAGEATERNVKENVFRNDMTPMDIAIAAKKLLDAGRKSDYIRKLFAPSGRKEMSPVRLAQYLKLNDLERKQQLWIHYGEIPKEIALQNTALPMAAQVRALERLMEAKQERMDKEKAAEDEWLQREQARMARLATKGEEDPTTSVIPLPRPSTTASGRTSRAKGAADKATSVREYRQIVREPEIQAAAKAAGKSIPTSMTKPDAKEFYSDLKAISVPSGTRVSLICKALMDRMDGRITLDQLRDRLQETVMESAPEPKAKQAASPAKGPVAAPKRSKAA